MKKKILSLVLALGALSTMTYAAPKSVKVDCGEQARITATPATGYHFVIWSDGGTDATRTFTPSQDSSLRAFFAINRYEIIFNNWNDTVLQKDSVNHGSAVAFLGDTPIKTATAQYTFTFAGWEPNIVTPAVGNATYKAQFDTTVNKYDIAFLNWDSTILESKKWEYGQLPSYSGTPTRPADDSCTYSFTGWDKVVSLVSGKTEYIAQYSSTTQSYTITIEGDNGTTTGGGTYQYGTEVEITATPASCYKFIRWNDGNTNATRTITVGGTATYSAVFEKIQYTITVESDDETQGTTDVIKL